jgi:hypothetical protein
MKNLPKTAEELDKRFDEGEDLESLGFDLSKATRPGLEVQRVNVDFPKHFLQKLDREAELRGVSRQALIKIWLYERLQFAVAANVSGKATALANEGYIESTTKKLLEMAAQSQAEATKLLTDVGGGVKRRSKMSASRG